MKQIYLKLKDCLCGISSDKYLHCMVSLVIAQALCAIPGVQAWLALVITLCIGIAKELFDKYVMRTFFDMDDLKADSVGALLGVILALL